MTRFETRGNGVFVQTIESETGDAIASHRNHDDAQAHADELNAQPHYHVVAYIPGCLNDYDSGPFDTEAEAIAHLDDYMSDGGMQPGTLYQQLERGLYSQRLYSIAVEACTEECDSEYPF